MAKAKKDTAKTPAKKDSFMALARERFTKLQVAEAEIRKDAIENLNFVYNVGDGHWPANIRRERELGSRPCLTSNKLRKYVAQVANRERDMRMAGRVRPVDDKADVKTAQVIEGLIRQIEYASNANTIYTDAGEKAIAGGFGYWRLVTKEMDDSFNQEVFIEKIDNQFSVYLDPRGMYGFVRDAMTKKEFEEAYPDKMPSDFDLSSQGEEYSLWYEDDKVFIADYYYKEKYDKTIVYIINRETGDNKIIELTKELTPELLFRNGYQILRQKTTKAYKVKWAKISGLDEPLEEGDWAGKDIPIIEVVGDAFTVAGKHYKNALIADAKDPQRAYNFWITHMTETVALAPKSPYLVTPQEIKGFEPMWNEANKKNFPYLLFNPQGNRIPRRELPPQVPTGAAEMLRLAAHDIHDTIGMYEASFGQPSNERTGVAIRERRGSGEFGTYHFGDNFRRAILATTRQLIDVIPKIYDTERIIRILGEDGDDQIVEINKVMLDLRTGEQIVVHDLSMGKYDVVADVGLYSTRRQEAVTRMAEIMQSSPNISPLILDLVFKFADWPGAGEIKQRLEKYMPQLLGSKEPIGTEEQPIIGAGKQE